MKQNYNDCLNRLLKDEGGYTNDPSDSGGPTNFGITITDYKKYINSKGTASDVKGMSVDQAKVIYKAKYWDALDCDSLPSGVDYTVFDYGVNSGLGRPRNDLKRFKALTGLALIDAINDERVAFLKAIGTGHNAGFVKGWMARVARVRAYSKVLANRKDNSTGPAVGAGTLGTGVGLSQYFHQHETGIIIAAILSAVLIGTIVHMYKNRNT